MVFTKHHPPSITLFSPCLHVTLGHGCLSYSFPALGSLGKQGPTGFQPRTLGYTPHAWLARGFRLLLEAVAVQCGRQLGELSHRAVYTGKCLRLGLIWCSACTEAGEGRG